MSAGNEPELQNIHRQHQLFTGEHLMQAWFLLMNGMFLFISQGLGLKEAPLWNGQYKYFTGGLKPV